MKIKILLFFAGHFLPALHTSATTYREKSPYYRFMYTHTPEGQGKTATSTPKEVIIHEKSTPHDFNLLVYEKTGEFLTSLFAPSAPSKEIAFVFYKGTGQKSYSKSPLHKIIKESDDEPLTQTALAALPPTQKVVKYHPIDEELYFATLSPSDLQKPASPPTSCYKEAKKRTYMEKRRTLSEQDRLGFYQEKITRIKRAGLLLFVSVLLLSAVVMGNFHKEVPSTPAPAETHEEELPLN